MILPRRPPRLSLLLAILLAAASVRAGAQEGVDQRAAAAGWDAPRARAIVGSAIEARAAAGADRGLRNFRAEVEGHVYYLGALAPAGGTGEEAARVVRADQVALVVRWQRPGRSRQTLVGRRSERRLPTSIQYHIDHLTLVLNAFGNRIRLGEGTEVRDVLHPAAPGALDHYSYRLADSLAMRVAGREATVYRLEVRPRDPATAGAVGLMDVDPEAGAVVRLQVTFTPAAYRDPELERIELDLRSALWHGRWWLPVEQRQTVTRSVRWLDLPLVGVIRTRLRVTDLEVNLDSFPRLPPGHHVVSLPEPRLGAYDGWTGGLYESPLVAGTGKADREALEERAGELLRGAIDRPGGLRPSLPAISRVVRARRGEGTLLGVGGRVRLAAGATVGGWAGHPFAAEGLEWGAEAGVPVGESRLTASVYGDRYTDVGPWPGSSGLIATFGYLVRAEDFRDPYFRDGATLGLEHPLFGGRAGLAVALEEHRRARRVSDPPGDDPVRPVRPVAEGDLVGLAATWSGPVGSALGADWRLDVRLEAAPDAPGGTEYSGARVDAVGRSRPGSGPWSWTAAAGAGALAGSPPPQRLLLLGGRGTVPGWSFRRWGGDRAAWVRLEAGRDLVGRWIRFRGIAAAGWAEVAGPGRTAAETFGGPGGGELHGTSGVEPSLGAGVGLVDGLLRVDLVRGLDGGRWEWMVSADPRFWSVL